MNSREKILQSVRENKPPSVELPPDLTLDQSSIDLEGRFAFNLDSVGGVARFYESKEEILGALPESGNGIVVRDLVRGTGMADGKEPDITVIEARLAVAENGSVYVTDEEIQERNVLFLGHKLIAIVSNDTLIVNMHEAYEKIDLTTDGFGIFIAGPSATADIAQILVRGAHGPSEMEVWFYNE